MSKFEASNGVSVRAIDTSIGVRFAVRDSDPDNAPGSTKPESVESWLDPRQVQALRELFQHERDTELGRWRWPENPDYVVYPRPDGYVRVVCEVDGTSDSFLRQDTVNPSTLIPVMVARAYFEAHPEPKPWHDAKPGEVWALTTDAESGEHAWGVDPDYRGGRFVYIGGLSNLPTDHPDITAGRRIWPEES